MGNCLQTNQASPEEAVSTTIVNHKEREMVAQESVDVERKDNENDKGDFFHQMVQQSQAGRSELARKKNVWKNLDFFVLDNSLRETTVAQIQSHTLSDKQKIFKEVKKCGFTDIIVASFNSATRVDDTFVQWLSQTHKKDFSKFYSFSEITVGIEYDDNGNSLYKYNTGDSADDLPDGMKKNKLYQLQNTVFEADFGNEDDVKWGETWTVDDMCKLIEKRIRWAKDNIYKNGRNFLNIRDLSTVMQSDPERMIRIIKHVATMPKEYRLYGMIFEEPGGECMPEDISSYCKVVRKTMDHFGWEDGKLLCHIHAKMGYKDVITMDCLANGCDGIWAAVCEEGAAVGHCCSAVTTLNLIRHGNAKVLDKYNCLHLRQAAIEITKITTKSPPHPKQIVYGERATDLVFGGGGMGGGGGLDLSTFFGLDEEQRITTLATPDMIANRLKHLFGNYKQFTRDIAIKMKAEMIKDLNLDIKNEYHSPYGIALLFERAGGKATTEMLSKLDEHKSNIEIHNSIRQEIHNEWNKYTIKNVEKNHGNGYGALLATMKKKQTKRRSRLHKSLLVSKNSGEQAVNLLAGISEDEIKDDGFDHEIHDDDFLTFDRFYHGFMQPYFGCYRCHMTKHAFSAIDIDKSGTIEWYEFCTFVDWTLNQYTDEITQSSSNVSEMAETCLRLTFEKGIIPVMRSRLNEKLNPFDGPNFRAITPDNFVDHTATFIMLHGIADFDEAGGNGIWWHNQFSLMDVNESFPYIRFVFPTSSKLPITALNDSVLTGWFDVNHTSNKDFTNINGVSGLHNNLERVKALIRHEVSAYNIKPERIIICGINQGALMALKASLELDKPFAAVVCINGFLFGNSKKKFNECVGVENSSDEENDIKRKLPIYWFDTPNVKLYNNLGNEFSKKCFDYLKQDCQLNAFYQKHDFKRNDTEAKGSAFGSHVATLIGKYLPANDNE